MNKHSMRLLLLAALASSHFANGSACVSLDFFAQKGFSNPEPQPDNEIRGLDWSMNADTPNLLAYVGFNEHDKDVRIGTLEEQFHFHKITQRHFDGDNGHANATSWLDNGKTYLAVGGFTSTSGEDAIKIYRYKNDELYARVTTDMPDVFALDWISINGQDFLAVGGYDNYGGRELRVYQFINGKLELLFGSIDEWFHGSANTVEWITVPHTGGESFYLAVGGCEQGISINNAIRVYSFDPNAGTLTLIATQPFDFDCVYSVSWVNLECGLFLAAGGHDGANDEQIRVYFFDGFTLTLVTETDFNYGTVYGVDWVVFDGIAYLAVGGDDGNDTREVRLYSFNCEDPSLVLETSLSLGTYIPSCLQWQIIAGTAYLAIGGSFAGADATKQLKIYQLNNNC